MKFLLFSINPAVHYGLRTKLNLNLMVKLGKREKQQMGRTARVAGGEHTTDSN